MLNQLLQTKRLSCREITHRDVDSPGKTQSSRLGLYSLQQVKLLYTTILHINTKSQSLPQICYQN